MIMLSRIECHYMSDSVRRAQYSLAFGYISSSFKAVHEVVRYRNISILLNGPLKDCVCLSVCREWSAVSCVGTVRRGEGFDPDHVISDRTPRYQTCKGSYQTCKGSYLNVK